MDVKWVVRVEVEVVRVEVVEWTLTKSSDARWQETKRYS